MSGNSGTSDHFFNSSSQSDLHSQRSFSFYNFSTNSNFFLKNKKVEELEFPQQFNHYFNINNLFNLNKDNENLDENVKMENTKKSLSNNDVLGNGHNSNFLHNLSEPTDFEQIKKVESTQNHIEPIHTQHDYVDDFEFFETQNQVFNNYNNFNSEKENSISGISNVSSSQKSENLENKFKILAVKPQIYQNFNLQNEPQQIKPIQPLQQSATKKLITKEFFSQQLNSICNIPSSSKNTEVLGLENKLGIQMENPNNFECPNYDLFSEENLKEEMKKYGMKPGSFKFMVRQLKDVWNFINLSKLLL